MNSLRKLDDQLLLAINSVARRTPWLHGPFLAYAKYGLVLFGVLLVAGILISRRGEALVLAKAGWACIATMLVLGLNQPVGHVFAEARPYVTHPQILRLADVTTDFSFPSDHAVMAGAVATGLLLVNRRLGLFAALAAALMAVTRVYIGAHYPWDVLGGLAFGAAAVLIGWAILGRPLTSLTSCYAVNPACGRSSPSAKLPLTSQLGLGPDYVSVSGPGAGGAQSSWLDGWT
jgi:membrane-associated phospholipid phosphatase